MQFDFRIEMAKRTDKELIQVLTVDKDNYLPEALSAANEEFEKRNLLEEKISSITKDVTQKKEIENRKATEPLDIAIKVTTFFLPLILTLILSAFYKAGGYDRKARDLAVWTLYGFCFYAIIILIVLIA
jgi:hypothetical protein